MLPLLAVGWALCAAAPATGQQPSPIPRADQGPYLLQAVKERKCYEGTDDMVHVALKSCSKTSHQQFYYSPTLAAFKLGKKCLGVGPMGTPGGLQLLTCPEQMNQNFKAMWTCSRDRQCCVADNDKYCIHVKDGTSFLPTWLPDVDMGSTSGIWRMVWYFIAFTLFLDAVLCGLKLAVSLLRYLLGFLQKQEPPPEDVETQGLARR